MPVKSLFTLSQEVLIRHLDSLTDVGNTPYVLLKNVLKRATPKQLYRIEQANPHLMPESDELWLTHCLTFQEFREGYQKGLHRDPAAWRSFYWTKIDKMERLRQTVGAKIRQKYNEIQNEKAARSIKVLSGIVPTRGRNAATYDAAKRSTQSRLFQETRKAAERSHAMFQCSPKRSPLAPSSQPPQSPAKRHQTVLSTLERKPKRPVTPTEQLPQSPAKRRQTVLPTEEREHKPKRPVARVNYDIFKELS